MYFFVLFYEFLCSLYCLFCGVSCIVCVYMCTEKLPPGGYPIADKYISYHITNMKFQEMLYSSKKNWLTTCTFKGTTTDIMCTTVPLLVKT